MVLRREAPDNPLQVVCHREASLEGERYPVISSGDPLADCAAAWASGEFGGGDVRRLTACTGATEYAAVFPGGPDVCSRLGLATFAPFAEDVSPLQQLQAELSNVLGPECTVRHDAVALVEDAIGEAGLAGWRVDASTPVRPERPCATWSVDLTRKVVVLGGRRAGVPVPPAPATTPP